MKMMRKTNKDQLCQECRQNPFQYQCPRCSFRSCCLACCQAHKQTKECSGKRDRTSFLTIGDMTDATLQNDYHFLEDVVGRIDANQRFLRQSSKGSNKRQRTTNHQMKFPNEDSHVLLQAAAQKDAVAPKRLILPLGSGDEPTPGACEPHSSSKATSSSDRRPQHGNNHYRLDRSAGLSNLQNQARYRGITLLCLPPFMERHKRNETHIRNKTIIWTVEWCVYDPSDGTEPSTTTRKMSETAVLWDELCGLVTNGDQILTKHSCLIKNELNPANAPRFSLVSLSSTLANAISDQTIIEFPTIHIVPPNRLQEFPLSIQLLETNDQMKE